MASNLPPGVNESDIPGNRPQDQEVEISILLTVGEVRALRSFANLHLWNLSTYQLPERSIDDILKDVLYQIIAKGID